MQTSCPARPAPDKHAQRRAGVREVSATQIKAPELSEEQQAEFKQAALANARCMREHGIDNFPDPAFDENGGAQIRIERAGIEPRVGRSSRRRRRRARSA